MQWVKCHRNFRPYNAISLSTPHRFMCIAIAEQKARRLLRATRTQRRKRASLSPGCKQLRSVRLDAIDFSGTVVARAPFVARIERPASARFASYGAFESAEAHTREGGSEMREGYAPQRDRPGFRFASFRATTPHFGMTSCEKDQ